MKVFLKQAFPKLGLPTPSQSGVACQRSPGP